MAEKNVSDSEKNQAVSKNFLRQFRDTKTREFKQISAAQFMDVWNHYDTDGNGYIEGTELDGFLTELVSSVNVIDIGPEAISESALRDAKKLVLNAFDENNDGRIDIAELAQILPTEENFLLLFRRDHPLESSVEFMKIWREYDSDHSGFIEADELKNFLHDLLIQSHKEAECSEEQLIIYADTMLQLFDFNKDGKLQLSEMAKLLPVRENFLCRPIFKGASRLSKDDIERVFKLYDVDGNGYIENEELHGFLKDLMELVHDFNEAFNSFGHITAVSAHTHVFLAFPHQFLNNILSKPLTTFSHKSEEYDADDLIGCQAILLQGCDLNHDGKINKEELTMVLTSCHKQSVIDAPHSTD